MLSSAPSVSFCQVTCITSSFVADRHEKVTFPPAWTDWTFLFITCTEAGGEAGATLSVSHTFLQPNPSRGPHSPSPSFPSRATPEDFSIPPCREKLKMQVERTTQRVSLDLPPLTPSILPAWYLCSREHYCKRQFWCWESLICLLGLLSHGHPCRHSLNFQPCWQPNSCWPNITILALLWHEVKQISKTAKARYVCHYIMYSQVSETSKDQKTRRKKQFRRQSTSVLLSQHRSHAAEKQLQKRLYWRPTGRRLSQHKCHGIKSLQEKEESNHSPRPICRHEKIVRGTGKVQLTAQLHSSLGTIVFKVYLCMPAWKGRYQQ